MSPEEQDWYLLFPHESRRAGLEICPSLMRPEEQDWYLFLPHEARRAGLVSVPLSECLDLVLCWNLPSIGWNDLLQQQKIDYAEVEKYRTYKDLNQKTNFELLPHNILGNLSEFVLTAMLLK